MSRSLSATQRRLMPHCHGAERSPMTPAVGRIAVSHPGRRTVLDVVRGVVAPWKVYIVLPLRMAESAVRDRRRGLAGIAEDNSPIPATATTVHSC